MWSFNAVSATEDLHDGDRNLRNDNEKIQLNCLHGLISLVETEKICLFGLTGRLNSRNLKTRGAFWWDLRRDWETTQTRQYSNGTRSSKSCLDMNPLLCLLVIMGWSLKSRCIKLSWFLVFRDRVGLYLDDGRCMGLYSHELRHATLCFTHL